MVSELAYILGYQGTQMQERRLDEHGNLVSYRVRFAVVACPHKSHENRLAKTMLEFLYRTARPTDYDSEFVLRNILVLDAHMATRTLWDVIDGAGDLSEYSRQLRRERTIFQR